MARRDNPHMIQQQPPVRVRAAGGGRKKLTAKDAHLLRDLDALVEPTSRGDPMSPLRWTCKSTYRLAEELKQQEHEVSQRTVCDLLSQMDYSLQSTRKTREGKQHEDRDAQFRFIAQSVSEFQAAGDPVISVDTKKKELIGEFKNAGREWQPKGTPEKVRVHDFIDPELGKVAPYGVYDLTANTGWVNIGIDHDTAEFAVQSIRRWWREMGQANYPRARRLPITAACGGSNGYRVRLWHSEGCRSDSFPRAVRCRLSARRSRAQSGIPDRFAYRVEALALDTADGGPAVLVGTLWVENGKLYNTHVLLDGGKVTAVR